MPTLSVIRSQFANMQTKNGHVNTNLSSGGLCSVVDFGNELTKKELEYCRLVATSDFFQLVRTAIYMNEGLTFREATIKYLKAYKDAKSIHIKKL